MDSTEPFSSTFKSREASYVALLNEIKHKVVGPMRVRTFLDEFLPALDPSVRVQDPGDVELKNLRSVKEESPMYEAFIEAFETPVEGLLKFWDSHTREMEDMSGIVIQPDLCILDDSRHLLGHKRGRVGLDDVGITIEMKYHPSDNPFADDPSEGLQQTTQMARYTFGQVCAHATAHMASQFRTHVFSVLVFPDGARLFRWDRAGVIVTDKIPFCSPTSARPMSEFFLRYALATETQRGVDPSAKRLSPAEVSRLAQDIVEEADSGSVYRFSFTSPNQSDLGMSYVAAVPCYMGPPSPTGRATRVFKAFCEQTGKEVFLKDTWRILGGSLIPEHDTYSILKGAGITHVATLSDYHDLEDQETRTAQFYDKDNTQPLYKFRHYRLVLEEYLRPVTQFKDVKQLVQVFRDTLQAHREAHEHAHVLHRDISPSNIMIDKNGRGILVDWDLSKYSQNGSSLTCYQKSPERMGTWQFMACRLLQKVVGGSAYPEHDREDDHESFWLSFFWLAANQCEMYPSTVDVAAHISAMYDTKNEQDGYYTVPLSRQQSLRDSLLVPNFTPFKSQPLCSILQEFQSVVSQRYRTPLEHQNRRRFAEIWEATLQEFRDQDTIPEPSHLRKRYAVRLFEEDLESSGGMFARHLARNRWPEEILERYLKPGKFLDPVNTVDIVHEVDWITGNANILFMPINASSQHDILITLAP